MGQASNLSSRPYKRFTTIDSKYRLLELIGGGMGAVYLCERTRTHEAAGGGAKVLPHEKLDDQSNLEQILPRGAGRSGFEHDLPNIVRRPLTSTSMTNPTSS